VIAASFARIFFRNAINIGLPILECADAARVAQPGQTLQIDLSQGTIAILETGEVFRAEPYPPFLMELVASGGLIPYTRRKLGKDT
jgi:3-isopropylmalate dehydratase small subunit